MTQLELTKKESKLLSQQYNKTAKLVPLLGYLLIVLSMCLIPFSYQDIQAVENAWQQAYEIQSAEIKTETKLEVLLKDELLSRTQTLKELATTQLTEKLFFSVLIFLTIGVYMLLFNRRERAYRGIIRKLKQEN